MVLAGFSFLVPCFDDLGLEAITFGLLKAFDTPHLGDEPGQQPPFCSFVILYRGARFSFMNLLNLVYLFYALSAYSAMYFVVNNRQVYAKVRGQTQHEEQIFLSFICKASLFLVFILALGTGTDNLRLFLGGLIQDLPDGSLFSVGLVSCLKNITCGNKLTVSSRPIFMEIITWFCFSSHEICGALFAIPVIYLWYILPNPRNRNTSNNRGVNNQENAACNNNNMMNTSLLPTKPIESSNSNNENNPKKCCCCMFVENGSTRWSICKIVVILSFIFSFVGAFFFFLIEVSSGALILKLNSSLFIWQYTPRNEQPFALLGVFIYSFVNLFVCTKIFLADGKQYGWYFLLSYFCFLGQGGCQSLGDYAFLFSNCFEQLSLWSLIFLGKQIYEEIEGGEN